MYMYKKLILFCTMPIFTDLRLQRYLAYLAMSMIYSGKWPEQLLIWPGAQVIQAIPLSLLIAKCRSLYKYDVLTSLALYSTSATNNKNGVRNQNGEFFCLFYV
jgi:hypothetical protein